MPLQSTNSNDFFLLVLYNLACFGAFLRTPIADVYPMWLQLFLVSRRLNLFEFDRSVGVEKIWGDGLDDIAHDITSLRELFDKLTDAGIQV